MCQFSVELALYFGDTSIIFTHSEDSLSLMTRRAAATKCGPFYFLLSLMNLSIFKGVGESKEFSQCSIAMMSVVHYIWKGRQSLTFLDAMPLRAAVPKRRPVFLTEHPRVFRVCKRFRFQRLLNFARLVLQVLEGVADVSRNCKTSCDLCCFRGVGMLRQRLSQCGQ